MPTDLYTFSNAHDAKPVIKVNGKAVDYQIEKGICCAEEDLEEE